MNRITGALKAMDREQLEASVYERHGVTVEQLAGLGLNVDACNCGNPECAGWLMTVEPASLIGVLTKSAAEAGFNAGVETGRGLEAKRLRWTKIFEIVCGVAAIAVAAFGLAMFLRDQ